MTLSLLLVAPAFVAGYMLGVIVITWDQRIKNRIPQKSLSDLVKEYHEATHIELTSPEVDELSTHHPIKEAGK